MRLIGINGFKGSGKDETYRAINEVHAERVERRAFADNLKVMAMLALGYNGERETLLYLAEHLKQKGKVASILKMEHSTVQSHIDGRQYIINFGQNARATFGEDFWVDQVLPSPIVMPGESHLHDVEKVWGKPLPAVGVVTDVRMPNEARRVRQLGGEVWEVERPGVESDGQPTEQPLDVRQVDYVIVNDGTLDDLREKVRRALLGPYTPVTD